MGQMVQFFQQINGVKKQTGGRETVTLKELKRYDNQMQKCENFWILIQASQPQNDIVGTIREIQI